MGTLVFYLFIMSATTALVSCYQSSLKARELQNLFFRVISRLIVISPMVILIGLRSLEVGFDTSHMSNLLFSGRYELNWLLETQHDPLFILFGWFLVPITNGNMQIGLLITSLLSFYFLICAFEKWSDVISMPFSMLAYCLYFSLIGMDQFKQMLAMSILLYGFSLYKEDRKLLSGAWILVAGLTHSTALIGLLIYAFNIDINNHSIIYYCVPIVLILLTVASEYLFQFLSYFFSDGNYDRYFTGEFYIRAQSGEGTTGLRFFLDVAPCLLPIVFIKYITPEYRRMFVILLFATMPLRMLGYQSAFLYRLYYGPAMALTLVYGNIWKNTNIQSGWIPRIILFTTLIIYYFIAYSTSHGVIPYLTCFSG